VVVVARWVRRFERGSLGGSFPPVPPLSFPLSSCVGPAPFPFLRGSHLGSPSWLGWAPPSSPRCLLWRWRCTDHGWFERFGRHLVVSRSCSAACMPLDCQSPSSSSLPGGWFVAPWQFCFLFLGGEGIGLGIGLAGAMDLSVSSSGRPLAAHQCLFPPLCIASRCFHIVRSRPHSSRRSSTGPARFFLFYSKWA
jgi:hypothetical protein